MLSMEAKTMMQIAMECDCTYNTVKSVVKKEGILGVLRKENNRKYFNIHQQDLIHRVLYFEGKSDCLTFESKMNSL